MDRVPHLEEMLAPPKCSLRKYALKRAAGLYKWEAKVPREEGPFEGTYSKSSEFSTPESESRAKTLCHQWLQRFQASRALR